MHAKRWDTLRAYASPRSSKANPAVSDSKKTITGAIAIDNSEETSRSHEPVTYHMWSLKPSTSSLLYIAAVQVAGQRPWMEVDTGASAFIIGRKTFQEQFSDLQCKPLRSSYKSIAVTFLKFKERLSCLFNTSTKKHSYLCMLHVTRLPHYLEDTGSMLLK